MKFLTLLPSPVGLLPLGHYPWDEEEEPQDLGVGQLQIDLFVRVTKGLLFLVRYVRDGVEGGGGGALIENG